MSLWEQSLQQWSIICLLLLPGHRVLSLKYELLSATYFKVHHNNSDLVMLPVTFLSYLIMFLETTDYCRVVRHGLVYTISLLFWSLAIIIYLTFTDLDIFYFIPTPFEQFVLQRRILLLKPASVGLI